MIIYIHETVNVFDFDKTIFDGDTEFDFYSYLLIKRVLSILC